MPVIINEFEVINDEASPPTRGSAARPSTPPASSDSQGTQNRPASLARRLNQLRARRARVHAD